MAKPDCKWFLKEVTLTQISLVKFILNNPKFYLDNNYNYQTMKKATPP
ncbi:hypothetical protein AAE02nite_42090 [Adhaeribacter aerolatus]|uniref:Uncharacterized protein n=1 Tax=Adhaeribacter aerolatus TaxID=670289 RepID=A0A512B3K6_9BACT|nr:hypothetical protein AAE02nite_42090 [Adhaeribacter aerolatus]